MARGSNPSEPQRPSRSQWRACHPDERNAEGGVLFLQSFALVVGAKRRHVVSRDVLQAITGRHRDR
jgi:hypothetical protein